MCGICGKFKFNSKESINPMLIEKMCSVLKHRGPDSQGSVIDGNIGIGAARLSIIDRDRGLQPLSNENNELLIVFNGEIYNFKELRNNLQSKHCFRTNSDTEVIIHLYEDYGTECVKYLNGMFAFAIWDKRKRVLFLARDRFGVKPLFYTVGGSWLSFGSEIKAILCDSEFSAELDHLALHDYLSYNYVPSPKTLFKNIMSLLPGHFLICSEKEIRIKRYWDIDYIMQKDSVREDYLERFYNLLKEAVLRQLDSEKTIGIFVSGGIDSAVLAYMAKVFGKASIKTFSAQFNEPLFDNSKDAFYIAKKLNLPCTKILISAEACKLLPKIIGVCDSLVADPSIIPLYVMSGFVKAEMGIDVILSGEGADELLGGYDTYIADIVNFYYNRFFSQPIRNKIAGWNNVSSDSKWPLSACSRFKHFFRGAKYSLARAHYYWRSVFSEEEKILLYNGRYQDAINTDPFNIYNTYLQNLERKEDFNNILKADIRILLPNFMLAKTDSAGMASGLEIRVPFLDNDLAEFIIQMPFRLKINRFHTKYLLKKTMRGKLPRRTIYARKRGFSVPVSLWIKNEAKDMVREYLSRERLKKMGYFNTAYVDKLLVRHFSNIEDNTWKIWGLLNFSIWHSLFLE